MCVGESFICASGEKLWLRSGHHSDARCDVCLTAAGSFSTADTSTNNAVRRALAIET